MTAVRRLFFIRHAGTSATRHGDVAVDEALSEAGQATASRLGERLAKPSVVACSPARRARETAIGAGWQPVDEPRLRPLDLGLWGSRSLQDIGGIDPEGMVRWLSDPAARPHGGESIVELLERVRALLTDWHDPATGDLTAVTHAAVIRAAVVVALAAPAESFWRVDVATASVTEMHTRGTGWVLVRLNGADG